MTGLERLTIGTDWIFENVPERQMDFDTWQSACGTYQCWLGMLAHCPALQQDGFWWEKAKGFTLWGTVVTPEEVAQDFFEITHDQYVRIFIAPMENAQIKAQPFAYMKSQLYSLLASRKITEHNNDQATQQAVEEIPATECVPA